MASTTRAALPRRWLTIGEACEYSGFGLRTLRARIADGSLPAYKPRGSRALRIDIADLDDMIAGGGRIPSAHLGDRRTAAGTGR